RTLDLRHAAAPAAHSPSVHHGLLDIDIGSCLCTGGATGGKGRACPAAYPLTFWNYFWLRQRSCNAPLLFRPGHFKCEPVIESSHACPEHIDAVFKPLQCDVEVVHGARLQNGRAVLTWTCDLLS